MLEVIGHFTKLVSCCRNNAHQDIVLNDSTSKIDSDENHIRDAIKSFKNKDDDIEDFILLIQDYEYKTLDLSNLQIDSSTLSNICCALSNNTNITCLNLSRNPLGEEGIAILTEFAQEIGFGQKLEGLMLDNCEINNEGINNLGEWFSKQSQITHLTIRDNPFDKDSTGKKLINDSYRKNKNPYKETDYILRQWYREDQGIRR